MQPNLDDVTQMVNALFGLIEGIKKAQKGNRAANRLVLLQIIAAHGQVRPTELAKELGVFQSTITRQVQALESDGDVNVSASPDDLRSCLIRLTESGHEKLQALTSFGLERFSTFVADWDAEEVRMFTHLLRKFEQSKAAVARREEAQVKPRWRNQE
jgi:DNA-binding MarR family transcriptional regulator